MNNHEDSMMFAYTRRQAIEDGEQVDISEVGREAGIRFPVFMNRTVWASYVEVPQGVEGQDEAGRLWDILSMMRWKIKNSREGQVLFRLYVRNDNRRANLVTLKAVCGPTDIDNPNPAITIMEVDED